MLTENVDVIATYIINPFYQGEVRYDANGTRVPLPAKIFKYRVSNDSTAAAG